MKSNHPLSPTPKHATAKSRSRQRRNPDLVSFEEATAQLHCHRVTLLRLIERDQLHLLKVSGRWMFEHAELNALSTRNISTFPHLTIARARSRERRH